MPEVITGNTLDMLANNAIDICQKGIVHNLVLSGSYPYIESESDFVMNYDAIASEWQAPQKPGGLFINHGHYIHKHGDAFAFLVEELRRKGDSNRACISLINMGDIIKSHDDPIPSFMLLQFGFPQADRKILLVTAYFRALEVMRFLPINIAEISQIIRFLKVRFPEIEKFDLTIIAFKAYAKENFHCLRKAAIDCVEPALITFAVSKKNLGQIRDWLDSKINFEESVICFDGLHHLYTAIGMYKNKYNKEILIYLKNVLDTMVQLKQMRQSTSHGTAIEALECDIKENLQKAKDLFG